MRSMLLLCLSLAFASLSYSQKTELRANAYSGLFFFRGSGSVVASNPHIGDMGYYNPKPFGRKSDFSYALELQAQRATRQKHLYGLGVGFERLTSSTRIDSVTYDWAGNHPETGNVTLTNDFITFDPYVGQRLITKNITVDVQAGIDFSVNTRVYERAKITSEKNAAYSMNKDKYPVDIRPRLQLNAYYNKIGVLVGYSVGTTNFYHYDNPYFVNNKAYANYLRIGVSYRLK